MATEEEKQNPRELWTARLEEWRASGLSQAEYCRRHGLKQHGFTYWKKRLIEADQDFVALPIQPLSPVPPLFELRIEDNFRIHVKLNLDLTFRPGAGE